jgi:putative transposase
LNSDVNGAYNIIRKAIPDAFAKGIEGVGLHPIRSNTL